MGVLNVARGSWYTAEWLNMVKISKCCTDALSWLLRFQLIKWSFCKPIDSYSCRFSIKGASGEAAYSELMRKVLIKVAICSIAFINGKNSPFFSFFAAATTVVISCCDGCHWSSYCFNSLLCNSSMFIPGLHCFMRYSWHAQLNSCNACLWKYLSRDLCLYWMQQCLQFYPGDIDLTMLPKHILPFHAFNLFWSTWRVQESGLPSWALVPFVVIFGLPLGPFFLCRCKTFIWNFMIESQVNTQV